jgi:hypothetical protein
MVLRILAVLYYTKPDAMPLNIDSAPSLNPFPTVLETPPRSSTNFLAPDPRTLAAGASDSPIDLT